MILLAGGMPSAIPSIGLAVGVVLIAAGVVVAVVTLAANDWNPRDAFEDGKLFVAAVVAFAVGVLLLGLQAVDARARAKATRQRERVVSAKRLRETKRRHADATGERNRAIDRLTDAASQAAAEAPDDTPGPDAPPESAEERTRRLNALREGMWVE